MISARYSPQARHQSWIYFLLLFMGNEVLSSTTLSGAARWSVGLSFFVLLLYAAFSATKPRRMEKPLYAQEGLVSFPSWFVAGGLLLALTLRFYRLETFFSWPTGDEGWNGREALGLSRQWTWQFFHTLGQAPPLPVWTSAALFKLGFSPGICLWLPSAVASALTVVISYFAVRHFCSRAFTLLFAALLAFGFWPLYIGRFAHQGIWLPLWVCGCFFLWGRFLKAGSDRRKREAAALGLAAGLGSFTFTPWPVVAVVLGAAVWGQSHRGRRKKPGEFLAFGSSFLLGLLPFLFAAQREGFGEHFLKMGVWNGASFLSQASIVFHYFTVLFWGAFDPGAAYVPAGGGFLNPLLSAAFFLGFLEMIPRRKERWVMWFIAAFLIFLLPGLLSHGVEAFRVVQLLPLLLFPVALGLSALISTLPSAKRLWFLIPLFLISAGWDFGRLADSARNPRARPERWEAYQVLSALGREKGPGLILTDLDPANDATLSVMTYPFNAAQNTRLDPAKCKWLAIFVNVHYEPFLQKRFPEGNWYRCGPGPEGFIGGSLLAVFPMTGKNEKVLRRWWEAHRVFQEAEWARFSQTDERVDRVLPILERAYPLVQGDPFLEACFWDKRAAYEYQNADYEQHLLCYRMAVTRGYPTADLYFKLGLLLQVKGRDSEAREAFRKATQAPLDLTPARFELAHLAPRFP